MSESLREQMLKAGFKESEQAKKSSQHKKNKAANKSSSKAAKTHARHQDSKHDSQRRNSSSHKNPANKPDPEAIEARKKIKAEIKALIEAEQLKETKGEETHAYVVGKRIKQMFVNPETRDKLVSGDVVITRLNGSTYLIPVAIGEKVKALNPDWVVVTPSDSSTASDVDDEYADYQVPDDLTW